jgi:hypothetical protein
VIGGFSRVNYASKIPFPQYPLGYVEGVFNTSASLNPQSLFEEQLKERLATMTVVSNPLADQTHFKAYCSFNNVELEYDLNSKSAVSVQLYGINGQLIKSVVLNEIQSSGVYHKKIDIQNLNSGIYLVKLTTNDFSTTAKLIVSR